MAFLSYIQEARDLFYKQNAPLHAEAVLRRYLKKPKEKSEKKAVYELMGLILRAQRRFDEARAVYEKIDDLYQAGYCALLCDDMNRVRQHWVTVVNRQPHHWCLTLYGMLTYQLHEYPTLLQIRHYIEGDIANFIAADKTEYLNHILAHNEFLSQINLETPKFVGRALFNSGWVDQSTPFLLQGQRLLPNDPEIYYHLGQLSFAQRHFLQASLMLKQCLLISPTYQPASALLKQIPAEHPIKPER